MDGETTYRGTYTPPKNIIPPPPPVVRGIPDAKYLIWSNDHAGWWGPNSYGYTYSRNCAGRYTLEQAFRICADANKYQKDKEVPNECIVPE